MAKVPIPSRQSIGVPIYMIGMLYGQMVVELGHMPQRGMIIHMWSSFKIVFGAITKVFWLAIAVLSIYHGIPTLWHQSRSMISIHRNIREVHCPDPYDPSTLLWIAIGGSNSLALH